MQEELRKMLEESHNAHTGMKAEEEKSQYTVWKEKEVLESRMLFRFDTDAHVTHEMSGGIGISREVVFQGHPTLCMSGDNSEKIAFRGDSFTDWPWGTNLVHLDMQGADLRKFNRISMWVYADAPDRPNTWIFFVLCNGDTGSADRGGLDSRTGFNVPSNQWYQVFWEFGTHDRDRVREFVVAHGAEGVNPGDDAGYRIYLADLKAEFVEADVVEGWETEDRIAYSQIGYLPDAPKRAVTQNADGCVFSISRVADDKVVFEKKTTTVQTDLGEYQIMDFTDVG